MADVTAVYAIREYKTSGISELKPQHLEDLKKDFPNAKYVCIMVRDTITSTIEQAETIAANNHYRVVGEVSQFEYVLGPGKGSPPGTGSDLP